MKQEIVVADTDPKHWLKYKARSKPGLEGWTEPVPEESEAQDPIHVMSADELQQIVSTLLVSGGSSFRPAPIPRVPAAITGCVGKEVKASATASLATSGSPAKARIDRHIRAPLLSVEALELSLTDDTCRRIVHLAIQEEGQAER